MNPRAQVAYFSMEIALEPEMPTYSGGLGVLAGDTLRSAADLGVPLVSVTLLHRLGYFEQTLDAEGHQHEFPARWAVDKVLEPCEPTVQVMIEGRPVDVRGWLYRVIGERGKVVEVILLDTDLPSNSPQDRRITDSLYGGDARARLCQETVLGIGGLRMLRALGHTQLHQLHLNEGHAALAIVGLLQETHATPPSDPRELAACLEAVQQQCIFTTHTPVPAGHDQFPADLMRAVLPPEQLRWLEALEQTQILNMTDVALRGSHFVNGVAMRHGEVSRGMFPEYPIRSITNGIHPVTWACPSVRALFDHHIPDWRHDAFALRYAVGIPLNEIWWAHERAKRVLIRTVNEATDAGFDEETLTIGAARRATAYKRATLIFHDIEKLAEISRERPLQLVLAGKAHPHDQEGKATIRAIFEARRKLRGRVSIAYLPNYDMRLGRILCAGADVWLNTPVPPQEASGTSGMKAALNGVPSLSILDGWWLEGHVEDVTGWAIGGDSPTPYATPELRDSAHAEALYVALRTKIFPFFYEDRERFSQIMRYAIALNASFFNTQRMVLQYLYASPLRASASDTSD